ncbi:hypothetical protein [uncultured Eudoraea sp.]|uniref:hypothetical protein n=1 Tax=uncultured Eudoraea sp. TaxID=1035614 RepID=UPI00260E17CE|nr:hypothetical protein [uncultured Eudoraea sp.]
MKNKIYCLLIIFAFSYSLQAQLNKYKYIIVPKNFVGFKYENQYKTSTLIKYLFQQKGFDVVYDDNLPQDLNSNRCLGLLVQLNHKSTMFATIASLTLKDCNDKDVFVTAEGKSKSKDYTLGYKEAISYAFNSFNNVSYSYKPPATRSTVKSTPVVLKEEVKEPKAVKAAEEKKDIGPPKINTSESNSEVVTKGSATVAAAAASQVSTVPTMGSPEVWYAQEIPNGYQLVDSTPKIRLKVYNTSLPDIYIGVNGEIKGLVYSKNSKWYFEYYIADKLQIEELAIKF